jgi:glycosyltransferase involved in cell wall biosynthesis
MRIGILTYTLDSTCGGICTYTQNLVNGLTETKKHDYWLIHQKKTENEIYSKANELVIPIWNFPFFRRTSWHDIVLPIKLRKCPFDIVHDTCQYGPFFLKSKFKKVSTVHDLTSYIFPSMHLSVLVNREKYFFPMALKNTDKIISVSNSTKKDIIKYFNINESKIEVIYEGVADYYKPLEEKICNDVLRNYYILGPFILYVGTLEPRKNIPLILKAYYKLKNYGLNHKLVIVGKRGWKYEAFEELIKILNLSEDIIFTGFVPEKVLPAFLTSADLFIYPSFYEGFGLPPLEAMACGTPVITSNTSSLPEVVGDAGIMINPYDVNGLTKVMYDVLTNDGLKEDMRKKGLKRAKLFSWEKTTKETLKVYEEVYEGSFYK